jgi:pyruvate kinase
VPMLKRRGHRRARIVCTLGPASGTRDVVGRLVRAGMNVARLNFSHGTHESHRKLHGLVRAAARGAGVPVAVLQDLQGIKIRTGTFPGGAVMLKRGREVLVLPGQEEGSEERIYVSYPRVARDVRKGGRILLDDGLLELKVLGKRGQALRARVLEGGLLRDHKGVNLPGVNVRLESFTGKDRQDLAFGLSLGVDYVALSFVRRAEDVRKVRAFLRERGKGDLPLIAKIEKPEAVQNIGEILEEAQGIMIARGDLGVEVPPEEVPLIQKRLIEEANHRGKLVITATQMLESMTLHTTPTRAEATDVANAVIDGTDALMLSGETSSGKYPVPALRMMDRIIRKTESTIKAAPSYLAGRTYSEAVAVAAAQAAENIGARYVVGFTQSGYTARLLSKYRPSVPIVAFTPSADVRSRMCLYWGVIPRIMRQIRSTDEVFAEVERILLKEGMVRPGESVVITASSPIGGAGKTNMLKLHRIGDKGE